MTSDPISRRRLLTYVGAWGIAAAADHLLPSWAWAQPSLSGDSTTPVTQEGINLTVNETAFTVDGRTGSAITINDTIPGPLIRLREGQQATIRVSNRTRETTSIHWHGLILPPDMDGVPGVSFGGIRPGTTFTYQFPVRQSGTYWCHSHSGGQELQGMYAPLIIDPAEPEPFHYDRDHVVMLSDWSFESPHTLLSNLKKEAGYYNFQRRTAAEFVRDVAREGWWATLQNYLAWDRMRMDPTDLADVTGYTFTYLMNGLSPAANWTGLYRPGERLRLRVINAAAMTFYDVRIPGLRLMVVQVDGQNVQPVVVEEFRIGPAETYDVLVEPHADQPYTIFAETMDRSGYARGTLATRHGESAAIPPRRPRPLRTMADMGMPMHHADMKGMGAHAAQDKMPVSSASGLSHPMPNAGHKHAGAASTSAPVGAEPHGGLPVTRPDRAMLPGTEPVRHGPDHHGTGNQVVAELSWNRLHEPGIGLDQTERRVLVYTDLKSLVPGLDHRAPEREVELHLTGHMERYMWSFDGKKYSDAAEPIPFRYGERLRLTFVNDTMMEHPLHLHGMWMYLENGAGPYSPRKHTLIVKPAERVSVAITADAPGRWAFHCHLLLHMEAGMFRVVEVSARTLS